MKDDMLVTENVAFMSDLTAIGSWAENTFIDVAISPVKGGGSLRVHLWWSMHSPCSCGYRLRMALSKLWHSELRQHTVLKGQTA